MNVEKDAFIGTWRLLNAESITDAGEIGYLFGKAASGFLIYTHDGHMAVNIMLADRTNFASADLASGSPDEKLTAFDTYFSYAGTYEVQADRVIHYVEFSLFPNWCGSGQVRSFQFEGDQLILSSRVILAGEETTAQLTWQRSPAIR